MRIAALERRNAELIALRETLTQTIALRETLRDLPRAPTPPTKGGVSLVWIAAALALIATGSCLEHGRPRNNAAAEAAGQL